MRSSSRAAAVPDNKKSESIEFTIVCSVVSFELSADRRSLSASIRLSKEDTAVLIA